MTRQQKNELKIVQTKMQYYVKIHSKSNGFSSAVNCIYGQLGCFFIYAVFFVNKYDDNYEFVLRMNIKPYSYDDLFWRILNADESIFLKSSLRAIGAFSCPSIEMLEKSYVFLQPESLEDVISNAIGDFKNEANRFIKDINNDVRSFNKYVLKQSNIPDMVLLKLIAYILEGNYSIAKQIADEEITLERHGGYNVNGKDIYELISEYCSDSGRLN